MPRALETHFDVAALDRRVQRRAIRLLRLDLGEIDGGIARVQRVVLVEIDHHAGVGSDDTGTAAAGLRGAADGTGKDRQPGLDAVAADPRTADERPVIVEMHAPGCEQPALSQLCIGIDMKRRAAREAWIRIGRRVEGMQIGRRGAEVEELIGVHPHSHLREVAADCDLVAPAEPVEDPVSVRSPVACRCVLGRVLNDASGRPRRDCRAWIDRHR